MWNIHYSYARPAGRPQLRRAPWMSSEFIDPMACCPAPATVQRPTRHRRRQPPRPRLAAAERARVSATGLQTPICLAFMYLRLRSEPGSRQNRIYRDRASKDAAFLRARTRCAPSHRSPTPLTTKLIPHGPSARNLSVGHATAEHAHVPALASRVVITHVTRSARQRLSARTPSYVRRLTTAPCAIADSATDTSSACVNRALHITARSRSHLSGQAATVWPAQVRLGH